MRRSDDVFLFTLIDFLLQVFFFGLLLFVASQVLQQREQRKRTDEAAAVQQVLKVSGVSNITELTDLLTKLAPLDELRGTRDFVTQNGGVQAIERAVAAVAAAGGVEKVTQFQAYAAEKDQLRAQLAAMSTRIAQLEGWGKASCIPNIMVAGKLQPKSIARVVVQDHVITLEQPTAEMVQLLAAHGLAFETVRQLTPAQFRATFAEVVTRQPECRYFLSVVTQTRYLDPMRAVWSAFRTH